MKLRNIPKIYRPNIASTLKINVFISKYFLKPEKNDEPQAFIQPKRKTARQENFQIFFFYFFEISECVNKLQGRACLRWEICVWVYACVGNNRCEKNTIKSAASKRRIGEAGEKQRNLWKICVNFYWECIENIEHTLREKMYAYVCGI